MALLVLNHDPAPQQVRWFAQFWLPLACVVAVVWSAYYDHLAAVRKLAYAETLLASSQDTYDATFRSYGMGLSDIVALLTAERDLSTARYTLVRSRAELLVSAARLAYAAGTVAPGR